MEVSVRRRWLTAVAVAALVALPAVAAPPEAVAGPPGTRSIVSVSPGAFSSSLGQPAMTSSLTVQVSETAVTGDPNWSVTAAVTPFSDASVPAHTIPASALGNSANATVPVGGGGTITEGPAGGLGQPVTLFTDTGESALTVYNGTYTSTSTLTLSPPNGTYAPKTGDVYTSVLTVTLIG